jgi:hypothetical protein
MFMPLNEINYFLTGLKYMRIGVNEIRTIVMIRFRLHIFQSDFTLFSASLTSEDLLDTDSSRCSYYRCRVAVVFVSTEIPANMQKFFLE